MNGGKTFSKILFLCVANSARSQMAEAIARKILPLSIEIKSAGSRPGKIVHPNAIESLADLDTDISVALPKSVDSLPSGFLNQDCLVIRLCAEEECPMLTQNLDIRDWSLEDPANPVNGDVNGAFAKTKRELIDRLRNLKDEIFK